MPSGLKVVQQYSIPFFLSNETVLYRQGICRCHPSEFAKIWVLADFGFSTILHSKSIIQSRLGCGTEAYRAPELMEDATNGMSSAGKVSKYGDIWAIGCIIFKLATSGRSSAFPNDWTAIAYKRKHDGYDLPQLKPTDCQFSAPQVVAEAFIEELNLLLTSCFAREPKERPTAARLLSRFEALKVSMLAVEE